MIPGAAVAIIDPRYGKFSRAYGFADVATERRSQIHDRYRVGSITKPFVAVAILRLVEAGELGLYDRLSKFVAGIPNGDRITIWDLLGMRGGVVDFSSDSVFEPLMMADAAMARWTPADTLRLIQRHRDKAQPPNYQTVYSNSEYFLLGLVLEKITGRPVGVVINELIGEYGLHETGYPNDAVMPAPASHGYAYSGDIRTDVTMRTAPAVWGGGGLGGFLCHRPRLLCTVVGARTTAASGKLRGADVFRRRHQLRLDVRVRARTDAGRLVARSHRFGARVHRDHDVSAGTPGERRDHREPEHLSGPAAVCRRQPDLGGHRRRAVSRHTVRTRRDRDSTEPAAAGIRRSHGSAPRGPRSGDPGRRQTAAHRRHRRRPRIVCQGRPSLRKLQNRRDRRQSH
ncbi:beta-lactamase [Nocardia brasiliensis ATCC 700358]|uniref:Beta-lactamase n=1 Tax=Nocardia brasiliensis (strain ATCC 700358 / HUJEG-1) TaxID=1133849 RepID=K0F0F6_NOCB7|nr:beta-lactamase [Nocardia brasiliensis ATCC 700358]